MAGRPPLVMSTAVQERQAEQGPAWICQCAKVNKHVSLRCEECFVLRPDEKARHQAQRNQEASRTGEVIGRGGGFYLRQEVVRREENSDDEVDVFGRRRKQGSGDGSVATASRTAAASAGASK
ncbi:unnamed protein product, partial [Polarella glacialis]